MSTIRENESRYAFLLRKRSKYMKLYFRARHLQKGNLAWKWIVRAEKTKLQMHPYQGWIRRNDV